MEPAAKRRMACRFAPLAVIALPMLCCSTALAQQTGVVCNVSSGGNPPLVRAEGLSEMLGDVVLVCQGGTATPAGSPIPVATVTVFVNTSVTSRIVGPNNLSEALLIVDEPHTPSNPNTPLLACDSGVNPCTVLGTGTGVGTYNGAAGRYNVFQGRQAGPYQITFSLPFDAPGGGGMRVLRITNIRANAAQLGVRPTLIPTTVTEFITISGLAGLQVNNPQQTVAFVQPGLTPTVSAAATLDRCMPANAAIALDPNAPLGTGGQNGQQFTIHAKEAFATSFKVRNVAQQTLNNAIPPFTGDPFSTTDANQDIVGVTYNTETGFFAGTANELTLYGVPPSSGVPFPATNGLNLAGKADSGTRIIVRFSSIPASLALFVPTDITFSTGTAVLTWTDGFGAGVFSPVPGNAAGLASLNISGGAALAVYEVVASDPTILEEIPIPVALAFAADSAAHTPAPGVITASVSLAPYSVVAESSSTAPEPRFFLSLSPMPAFVLESASCQNTLPPVSATVTTSPAGRPVLIDGAQLPSPQVLQWIPGDQHVIGVTSPQDSAGVRYTFAHWSDSGLASHQISVPPTPVTFTATFQGPRYQLATMGLPFGTGTVIATPSSADGFYDPGTTVQLSAVPTAGYRLQSWSGDATGVANPRVVIMTAPKSITANFWVPPVNVPLGPYRFIPVPPCRVADTRNPTDPFGAPAITGGTSRDFVIPDSGCSIPATAKAYALNVTVVPTGPLGYVTVWPAGDAQPNASTLNSLDGRTKANAAIIGAGANGGAISVFASNTTDLVLDINGYFVAATDPTGLAFYPLTPCRIADTRKANGDFGGPFLTGGIARTFPVQSSTCGVPASAQAYSLNFTAVPKGPLGYLTTWPTGQILPTVSTLNAHTGTVTANAAIVPAGANGSIDVFASNSSDLVIDINGYFAPQGTGGLSLFTEVPCRVIDTRLPSDAPQLSGGVARDVNLEASACALPIAAQAYTVNATVVPPGPLGYLTLWPQGIAIPSVSTLNALDAAITSNMAIVPGGNGSISVFGSNATHLVLDVSGYFAP